MRKKNPTKPDVEHLITMAGLFKVTIEQLVHSDDIENATTLSADFNYKTLEKVFKVLSANQLFDKALNTASIKKKTYLFGLLYALCEDMDVKELSGPELFGMIDSPKKGRKNEPTAKKSTSITKKRVARSH